MMAQWGDRIDTSDSDKEPPPAPRKRPAAKLGEAKLGEAKADLMAQWGDRIDTSDYDKEPPPAPRKRPAAKLGEAKLGEAKVATMFDEGRIDTSEPEPDPKPQKKARVTKQATKKPAGAVAKKPAGTVAKKPAGATSSSGAAGLDEVAKPEVTKKPAGKHWPDNSGVFAYTRWAGNRLSEDEFQHLVKQAEHPLMVGSLCSGMGTEVLALKAVQQLSTKLSFTLAFVCEKDERKLSFLRERHPEAKAFKDIAVFADPVVRDADGLSQDVPPCDVLFGGFSCKDLSGLNTKPMSVQAAGSTGTTLRGTFDYLDSFSKDDRPRLVFLENVPLLTM